MSSFGSVSMASCQGHFDKRSVGYSEIVGIVRVGKLARSGAKEGGILGIVLR